MIQEEAFGSHGQNRWKHEKPESRETDREPLEIHQAWLRTDADLRGVGSRWSENGQLGGLARQWPALLVEWRSSSVQEGGTQSLSTDATAWLLGGLRNGRGRSRGQVIRPRA